MNIVTAAPDWSAVTDDAACPLCEYNLRGLSEPRCPECGYRFEWLEVMDPVKRIHPWLFEHHPERNVWSFVRTTLAALRPWRFWKSVRPTHELNRRRLLLYWLVPVAAMLPAWFSGLMMQVEGYRRNNLSNRSWYIARQSAGKRVVSNEILKQYGSLQAWLDAEFPISRFKLIGRVNPWEPNTLIPCVAAIWPLLTFLALQVFRISMHKAAVNSRHVERCIIYSAGFLFWSLSANVITAGLIGFTILTSGFSNRSMSLFMAFGSYAGSLAVILLAFIWWLVSMCFAYQRYLRFDHPVATVLASQVVVGLAMLNILLLPMWLS